MVGPFWGATRRAEASPTLPIGVAASTTVPAGMVRPIRGIGRRRIRRHELHHCVQAPCAPSAPYCSFNSSALVILPVCPCHRASMTIHGEIIFLAFAGADFHVRRSTSVSYSSSGEAPIQTALTQRYSAILAAYLLDHQPLETQVDLRQTPNQPLETRDGRISTKTNEKKTLCGGMNAEGLRGLTVVRTATSSMRTNALPTELQFLDVTFAPQSNSQQYSTE